MTMNAYTDIENKKSLTASFPLGHADLNIEQSSALFTDTCNLLSKRQVGHMPKWAYLNGGRKYLEVFFQKPGYDGVREIEIISSMARQFGREFKGKKISLLEIGPGQAASQKTGLFLRNLQEVTGQMPVVEYYSLDIVEDYATLSAQQISDEFRIPSRPITSDYTSISRSDLDLLANPVIISWNSPIWNAGSSTDVDPDFKNSNNLKKFGNIVDNNGLLFLTHFPINDGRTLDALYRDTNCEKAVMAIAQLIERKLEPECHTTINGRDKKVKFTDAFSYDVYVDHKNEQVDMNLVSKYDTTIKIGAHFEVSLHSGQRFTCVRSSKPSIQSFNRIVRMCNANLVNTVQNPDGDVAGQALRFNAA